MQTERVLRQGTALGWARAELLPGLADTSQAETLCTVHDTGGAEGHRRVRGRSLTGFPGLVHRGEESDIPGGHQDRIFPRTKPFGQGPSWGRGGFGRGAGFRRGAGW